MSDATVVPGVTPAPHPDALGGVFAQLVANVEGVIKGKGDVVRLALTCLLAEGHLLIEDVPGVGKTSLAKAIAASIDGDLKRIQFTPDLLPSDVTGVSIYNEQTRAFEFHPGPVFANIVLGDEINRASPKTQSAMLEVMQEYRVTVDGISHEVPRPFMVMATQNPVEYEGTYRLPEAQRDRFLMRATIGYPDVAAEASILANDGAGVSVEDVQPVVTAQQVNELIGTVRQVTVAPEIEHYIARLAAASREAPELLLGVSPRGSLALSRAARAHAATQGRSFVIPEDVKALIQPVLAHRVVLTPEAEIQGHSAAAVIDRVVAGLDVPQAGLDAGSPPPAPSPAGGGDSPAGLPAVELRHLAGPATGKKKRRRA